MSIKPVTSKKKHSSKRGYAHLGNWGKRERHIPKKKVAIILVLLGLASIFAVSKNSLTPIPSVQGDYNSSFSHTRTPIFVDSNLASAVQTPTLVTSSFNDTCSGTAPSPCTVLLTAVAGDAILVSGLERGSGCPFVDSVTDTLGNTFTLVKDVSNNNAMATMFRSLSVTGGADKIVYTPNQGCAMTMRAVHVSMFSGVGSIGATGEDHSNIASTPVTSTISLTTSVNSLVYENMFYTITAACGCPSPSPQNSQTQIHDSNYPSFGDNGASFQFSPTTSGSHSFGLQISGLGVVPVWYGHVAAELLGNQQSPLSFTLSRWNYNTTCVVAPGNAFNFTYQTGSSGLGGNNCSSADIAVTKTSTNFQAASAKMMEIDQAVALGAESARFDLVLRTNGTLPSFTENYNPFNDPQVRLVWSICSNGDGNYAQSFTDPVCSNVSTVGGMYVFIAHDQTKSIMQEGLTNDLIVSFAGVSTLVHNEQQLVLNFTGPTNFINWQQGGSSFAQSSNNTASQFQFGQDYYIMAKANFNTNLGTSSPQYDGFFAGVAQNSLPTPFAIFSVPSSCTDPINKAACSLATAQPVFNFNPLDPSSWGNAIIKGLLWVFTVAIPQGLNILAQVLVVEIQVVFNTIGRFFGWGPLGDNIISFFSGAASLLASIGTALGWLANLVTGAGSLITDINGFSANYFPGLTHFLSDLANGIPLAMTLAGEIAVWFPNTYMIIMISFYFLLVLFHGLGGFFDWIRLVKWSSFSLFNMFARILMLFIDLITAILGRISVISPGHKFPRIPHLNSGPIPRINLGFGEMALFHDPTAWFFGIVGFVFTWLWVGTSGAGLPGSTQTIIQNMQSLTVTMFGITFMVLILVIPGWILGKMGEKGLLEE